MRVVMAVGMSVGMSVAMPLAGVCVAVLLSCSEQEPRLENLLQLTLGGNNRSLSRDLARLEPDRDRPRRRPEVPPGPAQGDNIPFVPVPQPKPQPKPQAKPEPWPRPEPEPEPEPQPQPELQVVTLAKGQNLYRLALQHLGRGSRWTEIAELNGWSERQVARLRAGTKVRLPRRR